MIKNNSVKNYFFYFLFVYTFLFFTNTHFSFEESLKFGGADGFSYMSISKESPFITSEKLMSIHSERFFFPYIIGLFSKFLEIDFYLSYKIFVFIILAVINIFTIKILRYLSLNFQTILILLALINFNPYLVRFYLAIPTIINDLIFIAGILIVFEKIITNNKNKIFILIGYIFTFASRQTSIGLILAYLVTIFIKGKKLLSIKYTILGLLIFILFLFLSIYYSSFTMESITSRSHLYSPKMRLFGFFIQDVATKEKIIFLLLPLLSYAPLIFYLIFTRKFEIPIKKIINSKLLIFLFTFIILIIFQPILSGVEVTNRNVLRLTSLAYIPFLIFIIMITKERKNFIIDKKRFNLLVFIVALFHSFHPTFSIIKIFDILRF
tara:strand:+ start:1945 stop:3084 length:1140 start_codon:yes stop_codon:yes gene_type:complete